ncbi:sulfate adenylyltransferase subunit CysD [Sphingomonas sediminicola]|uniref:Sulfate adenylyltransferase subunit 2 n=1 Tax=Sphingomonas sediminicola TaxID=386874 RepID=A0ABX6TBH8_9SPHN|nr:sulfate adenylyltransferase subunit CysD [Sphingomonas sediminicola]QNP46317.1 sulfate adenylyltransferase subunit CysD [Sphingomonas sediminicola]
MNALSHLNRLEAESIYIFREVVAEAQRPVLLYSVGKDSSVLLQLALKAFYPARPPFPFLHIASGWDFRDLLAHRDRMAAAHGLELLVESSNEAAERGINPFDTPTSIYVDNMLTQPLKRAIDRYGFDAAFGGARRDEEKARAKERIFSLRTATHRWDPKRQRPEIWNVLNARKARGESIRVYPLSNWTELDVWLYIHRERIPIVPLYFSQERRTVERGGSIILADDNRMRLEPGETPRARKIRFRTLGCYPLTAAIESPAMTVEQIIAETLIDRTSERAGRLIDHEEAAAMERKKAEGYF